MQTIVGSFGLPLSDPPSHPWQVELPDGDTLYCLVSKPPNWKASDGIFLLIHGLAGSHRSRYMVRLARKWYRMGRQVVRVNLRGCGPGAGLARQPAYAGESEDILVVCKRLKQSYPNASIQAAGFSLGGNILLKLLGELNEEGANWIERAVAVCPSVDPHQSTLRLKEPKMRLYERSYMNALFQLVESTRRAFPDLSFPQFPKGCHLLEFDRLYTAPRWGYASEKEYYDECAADSFTSKIEVPSKILYSKDDPIVSYRSIEALEVSPAVSLWRSEHGGHMGFLGWTGNPLNPRWMDQMIMDWLE